MYSILIKNDKGSWDYYQNPEGQNYTGTLAEVKAELTSLLRKYVLGSLKVVHNTTIDLSSITIADVTE